MLSPAGGLGSGTQLASACSVALGRQFAAASSGGAASKKFVKVDGGPKKKKGAGDGDPRLLAVVEMLTRPDELTELKETPEQYREALKKTEEYMKNRIKRDEAWAADLADKHALMRAALEALPPALRAKAEKPDLAPFPPNRGFLFETPPKAYMDL